MDFNVSHKPRLQLYFVFHNPLLPQLQGVRDSAVSRKTSMNRPRASLIHYKQHHCEFSYTVLWNSPFPNLFSLLPQLNWLRSSQSVIQQIPGAPFLGIKQPEDEADLTDCQE